MKITVYFESKTHAEIAAIFPNEDTYDACFPALEKIAKEARMTVTESLEEDENVGDTSMDTVQQFPIGEDTRPKDRTKQGMSPSTVIEDWDCTK